MSDFYISRKLKGNGNLIQQNEVFSSQIKYKFIILLAEPGAGKTALLSNLAKQYKTKFYRANVINTKLSIDKQKILIIDGFDEVAKLNEKSAIESILTKIESINPDMTVLSSRSSEWDDIRNTQLICDYLELNRKEIKTYYLSPLDIDEQRCFFNYHCKESNFSDFYKQLSILDMETLISNPQLLYLFIVAYKKESSFGAKSEVFNNAIKYLAQEHNTNIPLFDRCKTDDLIIFAEEIFTKILLSGESGVSLSEKTEIDNFHYLFGLSKVEPKKIKQILDTGLFKQVDSSYLYEPIHRIVAEYCAANYLVKKIKNPSDVITLNSCLSIIAPNNIVRTELRGLLGWMASLGNETIQQEIIKLDPYACIANGDPLLLSQSSKDILINELIKLGKENPFFRASDWHRSFNFKGFISQNMASKIKEVILSNNIDFDLKSLLVSLIEGSESVALFQDELITLLMNLDESAYIRRTALEALIRDSNNNWPFITVFQRLIKRCGEYDLEYASTITEKFGSHTIGEENVIHLFKKLADLYPKKESRNIVIGERYFIYKLIQSFSLEHITNLLDALTPTIKCICSSKEEYKCQCKVGISKIIGHLLDRYFELVDDNYNAHKLALWLKELRYTQTAKANNSVSVTTLLSNPILKYNIYINLIELDCFSYFYHIANYQIVHSGIILNFEDHIKLLDYAFNSNNVEIWRLLFSPHNYYWYQNNKEKQIIYRRNLRQQALQNDAFMKIWAKDVAERKIKKKNKIIAKQRKKLARNLKRAEKRNLARFEHNKEYLDKHESIIYNGKDWGWLTFFANGYLFDRQKIIKYKDIKFIEEALINGLQLLKSKLPSLEKLSLCYMLPNEFRNSIIILFATSYVIFKKNRNLNQISKEYLILLILEHNFYFCEIDKNEKNLFTNEIKKTLFQSNADKELFIQRYMVPQFIYYHESILSLSWLLNMESWEAINIRYCIEWIQLYPRMNIDNLKVIFTFLCKNHEENKLIAIIDEKIKNFLITNDDIIGPPTQNSLTEKKFWFEAAFFFLNDDIDEVWCYLKQEPETIISFYNLVSHWTDYKENWPTLTAKKIYKILDYFIDVCVPTEETQAWSSDNTREEKEYSTLVALIKYIDKDYKNCFDIFNKLLIDPRFEKLHKYILHHRYEAKKNLILNNYLPPKIQDITDFFDNNKIVSVEGLRAYLIEKLKCYQKELIGLETNPVNVFYHLDQRVDENTARDRIVDWLRPYLAPLDIILNIEAYMSQNNRCDFTATLSLNGQEHLLVIEVKGQWHPNLYTAASEQLYERYSIHPNAEEQGIYLVLWFGQQEKVANKKNHSINNAQELKVSIQEKMPKELDGKIDIFVLDVSK